MSHLNQMAKNIMVPKEIMDMVKAKVTDSYELAIKY
jgi:hypothetical protein